MNHINQLKLYFCISFLMYYLIFDFLNASVAFSENESEIIIKANEIEVNDNGNKISAKGDIFIESEDFLSSADRLVYDKRKEIIDATGNITIKEMMLLTHLVCRKITL